MSEKQYRDKIVTVKKQQATDETNRGQARAAAGKHRADAAKEIQKITSRTSVSMARTYQRNAESLEKRAQAEDKKVSDLSVKLSKSARDLATAEENLSREIKSTAKKDEDKSKAEPATGSRPKLLVLNGCDTLDGAQVLLEATPVVIAMATVISDLAARAFAARFYAAVASAQPIGPALRQGAVVLDLMGLDEGWKPNLLVRDDVAVDDLVLVQVPIE